MQKDVFYIEYLESLSSLDIKQLLELNTCTPVWVSHLVAEVLLEGVDGFAREQTDDVAIVIEVSAIHH